MKDSEEYKAARKKYVEDKHLAKLVLNGEIDSFAFGSDIEALLLCLKEFKENSGDKCTLDKYTIEFRQKDDAHLEVIFLPIIFDWMDGIPIDFEDGGRDGLGVVYLVNLELNKIVKRTWMR